MQNKSTHTRFRNKSTHTCTSTMDEQMEESSVEDYSTSPASPVSPGVVSDVHQTATVARQLVMSGDVELGAIVLDTDQAWDDEEEKVASTIPASSSATAKQWSVKSYKINAVARAMEKHVNILTLSLLTLPLSLPLPPFLLPSFPFLFSKPHNSKRCTFCCTTFMYVALWYCMCTM